MTDRIAVVAPDATLVSVPPRRAECRPGGPWAGVAAAGGRRGGSGAAQPAAPAGPHTPAWPTTDLLGCLGPPGGGAGAAVAVVDPRGLRLAGPLARPGRRLRAGGRAGDPSRPPQSTGAPARPVSLLAAVPGAGLARDPGRSAHRPRRGARLDAAAGLDAARPRRGLVVPDPRGAGVRLQSPRPARSCRPPADPAAASALARRQSQSRAQ